MSGPTSPHAEDGGSPAASAATPCPPRCPSDFTINAPCRIIKAGGGSVQISAEELPDYPSGTYLWETNSPKISLSDTHSATVTVTARADASSRRDAETITVTRTAAGCPPIVKTVNVTVAKVTFSKSANQRYGYDDYDTAGDRSDDHICVKSGGNTLLQVDIEGGLTGSDFTFECDDSRIMTAPRASASFEMRLTADFATAKLDTTLHAKCRCPAATSYARIAVHVYREKRVEVVVAKIGTNLRLDTADYAAHQGAANDKLKEAVVMYRMSNFNNNNILRVHYDLDGNRALSYDIANGGGGELDAIRRAMTGTGTKVRVAIVREMKSYYYLSADINATETSIPVTASPDGTFDFSPGHTTTLGTGATQEQVTVVGKAGSSYTVTRAAPPNNHPHSAGEPLEFPAAGWGCEPILVVEGTLTLDQIKWAIIHEVGHVALLLKDVNDQDNIMLYRVGGSDQRLRYCPRTRTYNPPGGTENQWDTIPR